MKLASHRGWSGREWWFIKSSFSSQTHNGHSGSQTDATHFQYEQKTFPVIFVVQESVRCHFCILKYSFSIWLDILTLQLEYFMSLCASRSGTKSVVESRSAVISLAPSRSVNYLLNLTWRKFYRCTFHITLLENREQSMFTFTLYPSVDQRLCNNGYFYT